MAQILREGSQSHQAQITGTKTALQRAVLDTPCLVIVCPQVRIEPHHVAVADAASDDYFELVLDEDEAALEVFNHPFAHAAARGLEFRTRRPEPEMLSDAA